MQCSLEGFLVAFAETAFSRCDCRGSKQPYMRDFVRTWSNSVQTALPVVDSIHSFTNRDVTRTLSADRLSIGFLDPIVDGFGSAIYPKYKI